MHIPALLVSEKLPAAHGAHRAGVGSLALATNVPGRHGCVASQNGWPGMPWNVLVGQLVHFGALMLSLKLPGLHGLQVRSCVALGTRITRRPAAHTLCLLQDPWPAMGWNSSAPHTKHEARLVALENVPCAHLLHTRSDVAVGEMI